MLVQTNKTILVGSCVKKLLHSFRSILTYLIVLIIFVGAHTTKADSDILDYGLIESVCYTHEIDNGFNYISDFVTGSHSRSTTTEGSLIKLTEIADQLDSIKKIEIPKKLKSDDITYRYHITGAGDPFTQYLDIASQSKEGVLYEIFFELSSIIEAAGQISDIYRSEANPDESLSNFLNNYDFSDKPSLTEIITDEDKRDLVTALVTTLDPKDFSEFEALQNLYQRLEKMLEAENKRIVSRVSIDGFFNELFTICELNYFNKFNAGFNMSIPADIAFIFEESRKELVKIDDVVLGARLSGSGSVDEIGACKSPGAIFNECTYLSIPYDDYILILITNQLTARERYNFKVGNTISYENCVLTGTDSEQEAGGYQFRQYFKSLGSKFKTSIIEAINNGKDSQDYDLGVTDTIYTFTSQALEGKLLPDFVDVLTCEISKTNITALQN